MSDKTGIEWTDATWNPLRGCSLVSAGCKNCYAMHVAHRYSGKGQPYAGLTKRTSHGPVWTGEVRTLEEALLIPWHWSKPRRIFVNSMSDLFHEDVPFEFIAKVFWIMSVTTRHTYQVLTKRPQRMLEFFAWIADHEFGDLRGMEDERIKEHGNRIALEWTPWREGKRHGGYDNCGPGWPYENVWLGVSVEDQATADERIPVLLQTPAAVRWISAEPLLGPINIGPYLTRERLFGQFMPGFVDPLPGLDWVVAGGESGPGARPMHPDWARHIRNQCEAARVPFLFKQWGAWSPSVDGHRDWMIVDAGGGVDLPDHRPPDESRNEVAMRTVGKKLAGRTLDGRTHNEYPA
jgi:protein gp37